MKAANGQSRAQEAVNPLRPVGGGGSPAARPERDAPHERRVHRERERVPAAGTALFPDQSREEQANRPGPAEPSRLPDRSGGITQRV